MLRVRNEGTLTMLFVGFALLISVGLALLISADAGALIGMSQGQTGQLLPLVVIVVFLASALVTKRLRFSQMFTHLVLWAGIFGMVMVGEAACAVKGNAVPSRIRLDTCQLCSICTIALI